MIPARLRVVAAAFVLLVASCSKDLDAPAALHSKFLPKIVVEKSSIPGEPDTYDSSRYSYDLSNRLKQIVSLTSGRKAVYRYDNEIWFAHDDFRRGKWTESENYWVNAGKQVDSSFHYDAAGDTITRGYVCNALHQWVEKSEYRKVGGVRTLSDRIEYFYNTAGDIEAERGISASITYTYYSDRLNSLSLGRVYEHIPVYLVHSQTVNSPDGSLTIRHNYTFDTNEHLLSDVATGSDGSTDIKTYYY